MPSKEADESNQISIHLLSGFSHDGDLRSQVWLWLLNLSVGAQLSQWELLSPQWMYPEQSQGRDTYSWRPSQNRSCIHCGAQPFLVPETWRTIEHKTRPTQLPTTVILGADNILQDISYLQLFHCYTNHSSSTIIISVFIYHPLTILCINTNYSPSTFIIIFQLH